ncbi:MAG: hypothetical protein ACK4VI_00015 [Alphaproteobacteria bacterium]
MAITDRMQERLEKIQSVETQNIDAVLDTANMVIPSKLDADQYMAEDLDGVTESLFGSGNMAYASLQATQTDEAIRNAESGAAQGDNFFGGSDTTIGALSGVGNQSDFGGASSFDNAIDSLYSMGGDNIAGGNVSSGGDGLGAFDTQDNNSSVTSTLGTFSAAEQSGNSGSALSFGGLGGETVINNFESSSSTQTTTIQQGQNGADGNDGAHGQNGLNGADGSGGGGHYYGGHTTIINNYNYNYNTNNTLIQIDAGDINTIINNSFTQINNTIITLNNSVTDIYQPLIEIVQNLEINNLVDLTVINDITQNLTETLTHIFDQSLTKIHIVSDTLVSVLNQVLGGGGGGGKLEGLHLTLNLDVLETLSAGLDVPLYDILAADISLDISLDQTLDLLGAIGEFSGIELINDTLENLADTTAALQSTLDSTTDILSNLDLKDLGASVDDVLAVLDSADDLVTAALGDIHDVLHSVIDDLGLEDLPLLSNPLDTLGGVLSDIGDLLGADGGLLDGGLLDGGLLGDLESDGLLSQTIDPLAADVLSIVDDLTHDALAPLTAGLEDGIDQITDIADTLTGGLLGGILGTNNNNQDGADSDITIDLDIAAGAGTLINETLSITLDPIEALVGDIDLNLDLSLNILGDIANPIINGGAGGTGEDTLLSFVGDLLSDTVEGILSGENPLDGALEETLSDAIALLDLEPLVNNILDIGAGGAGKALDDVTDTVDTLLGETLDNVTSTLDDLLGGGLLGGGLLGDGGGADEPSWTESILQDDILPDPIGTIAEGLGAVEAIIPIKIGKLGGGLFG